MVIFSTNWIEANTKQGEIAITRLQNKISELGKDTVEFEFAKFLKSIEISLNVEFNPKEIYIILFPQYKSTFENACVIFNNTRRENFLPISHCSESIFKKWIDNFYQSPLIIQEGKYFKINTSLAKQLFDEYESWAKSSKEFPIQLQLWLKKCGLEVSKATISYLLTEGMPYSGYQVSKEEIFHYSRNNRSYGIIGTLAYQLNSMVSKTDLYFIPSNYPHPLCQSIFISFARMEYYINFYNCT